MRQILACWFVLFVVMVQAVWAGQLSTVDLRIVQIETPRIDPIRQRDNLLHGREGLDTLQIEELMNRLGVPGVSVAVVDDFEVVWTKGYGVADVETGAGVDVETLFQAASISKPVAAMATLAAVEGGHFALDDDINDILTSWQIPANEHTGTESATPRGLLSYTSGTGDGFGFPGYEPGALTPSLLQTLDGLPPSNLGPVRIVRPPLTAFHYSGGGVTMMQRALMDAYERPFAHILDDTVLEPIGMEMSTFEQPLPDMRGRNAARAHGTQGESCGPKWHVYPELAAAGLWTTPTDLARFTIDVQKVLQGDSERVVSPGMARLMVSPVGVGDFGLGFAVSKRGEGWYFGHGGSNLGFRAQLTAHTLKGYGAVVMTNAERGGRVAAELVARIEDAYGWDSLDQPVPR